MKIGIAGAGAVGCHYGSLLQQSGNDVSYLARGPHLEAMQKAGLHHVSGGRDRTIRVKVGDQPDVLSGSEVIIFTCKMNDLDEIIQAVRTVAGTETLLVTLQNGMEAPAMVAGAFTEQAVAAGTAFIGARIENPGTVIHSAAGGMRLGLWRHGKGEEKFQMLVRALTEAGVPARQEGDVRRMLWRKLLWNCGFNAITAITRRYARDMAANEETLSIVREAMQETVTVANAGDVTLGEEDILKHIRVTLEMGAVKTSMWQDLDRGRRTEVDFINGLVVRRAAEKGIEAPVNRMLTVLVHAIEQGIH